MAAKGADLLMVLFRIYRYDPAREAEARYDEHEIEPKLGQTVLDVLRDLRFGPDPTLAFRHSCRAAICGSCGMRINKRARLACNTQVKQLIDLYGYVLIEPLGNLPVVRDLVVDQDPFWKDVHAVQPYLQPAAAPEGTYEIPKSRMDELRMVQDCIMCGCCLSDCTSREANPHFLGPAALAKAYRMADDPRDRATVERLTLYSKPNGIWDCDTCLFCDEVCPKGVRPMEAIMKLREMAIENGITHTQGAKHALAFFKTVEKTGKLNEALTAVGSLGVGGMLKSGPLILKVGYRGKNPHVRKPPIRGIKDVQSLMASVRESKRKRKAAK